MTTTMVIADDHEIVRNAISDYAQRNAGFQIAGSVEDAQSAVSACALKQPNLLVLDIEMPGRDALAAIADVKAASPDTRVVILTAYCRDTFIQLALNNGANGYLLKSETPAAIVEALARVAKGGTAYSKPVLDRLTRHAAERAAESPHATRLDGLTPRELEVLRYIGRGHDNDAMASNMSISKRTVERHVARLMDSLNIRDRATLQAFAVEQNLTV
jgi:DNA-binding NarL/FixJ family response regulator